MGAVEPVPGRNFDKKGFVSIWVSKVTLDEIPGDYFKERYGEGCEDTPLSQWRENFAFGYYDHDQIEDNGVVKGTDTLEKILGECSCSMSFLELAVSEAKKQGIESVSLIKNYFDCSCSPDITGIKEDSYIVVLVFHYAPNLPLLRAVRRKNE